MVVFVFVLIGPGVLMRLLGSNRPYASNRYRKVAYWLSLVAVLSFGVVLVAAAV